MRTYAGALALLIAASLGASESPAAENTLPPEISAIMNQPRYTHASWNLAVTDLQNGKTIYQLHADRLAFTGSVRKLFSVGTALNVLGPNHRFVTRVYRHGLVAGRTLNGDLIFVSAADLTLGGRLRDDGTVAVTNFDHNDANNLGTAILTPQDPLHGLNELARQVRASGISLVSGDVVVDDRLFVSYRVPNGKLLIAPTLVNENMVDVTIKPSQVGRPALMDWRPKTAAFGVTAAVRTVAAGGPADVELSGNGKMACNWPDPCTGTVTGTIPVDYKAPLSGSGTLVRTFRVEDPASFARIAFVQALQRAGVTVRAATLQKNQAGRLPAATAYLPQMSVAAFDSPPYAQFARLILKVSLNLGANLSLSLFGLTHGQRTIAGALAAERKTLQTMGLQGADFDFPTNGSGTPDSRAAARATVKLLVAMSKGSTAAAFRASLPILGVDGSIAETGRDLPAKGHVFAKPGTTIDESGLKAQVMAGYIDAKSGHHLAYAVYVNNVGPIKGISEVGNVFEDEAKIANVIYERN